MDGTWLKQHPATRPPDWRYRQASEDARKWRVRLRADADVETRRLTKCLMLLADAPDLSRSSVEASPDCRPYLEILAWHENRNLAARIEAIALARLPFIYAAQELNIDRANVRRYCFAFFDYWDRLGDRDYIIRHCVAPELRRGDPATARRRTGMKLLAYLCGPKALEELYGMFGKGADAWRPPAEVVRREAALSELDRIAEMIAGGDGPGAPLAKESLEACAAAVAQFTRAAYPENQHAWKFGREAQRSTLLDPFGSAEDAPQIDDPPASLLNAKPQAKGGIWVPPREPVDAQGPATKIGEAFFKLSHARAQAPAGAVAGKGIDPQWNADIFQAPVDAAAWAEQESVSHSEDDLYGSTLFHEGPDGKPQLIPSFAQAGATIVSLRPSPQGRPTAFYATDWPAAVPVPLDGFVTDWQTRSMAEACGGALVAARDAGEVAAWRRLGIAAIPVPQSPVAAESWGAKLWDGLAAMQLFKSRLTQAIWSEIDAKGARGNPYPEELTRISALERQVLIRPTLIAAVWDPLTVEPRSDEEQQQAVAILRDCWRYRFDADAAVAMWAPPLAYLQWIRAEVETGSPATVKQLLRASLENHLIYPCLRRAEVSAADGLVSARRRLAAIDAATPTEERERARRRYLEQYENVVVVPLLREGATSSSPTERMLTTMQAQLVGRFAEFTAAATLDLAGGDTSLADQSASVRSLCRLSAEVCNLLRTQKERDHGS
ncbi:hypothetical protein [Lacipirellula limnantheis]|uniref:Uncharacterized protein n=1 Tax=Lacipirellula limnantheis TaxID=2528024 RepID=A0A517TYL8_9BACT|nr:hypothetical protein [Lacipirellula limnantheis]QDT73468.1 hypothetical protein I41_26570 [Lacipirellula limnantheis]